MFPHLNYSLLHPEPRKCYVLTNDNVSRHIDLLRRNEREHIKSHHRTPRNRAHTGEFTWAKTFGRHFYFATYSDRHNLSVWPAITSHASGLHKATNVTFAPDTCDSWQTMSPIEWILSPGRSSLKAWIAFLLQSPPLYPLFPLWRFCSFDVKHHTYACDLLVFLSNTITTVPITNQHIFAVSPLHYLPCSTSNPEADNARQDGGDDDSESEGTQACSLVQGLLGRVGSSFVRDWEQLALMFHVKISQTQTNVVMPGDKTLVITQINLKRSPRRLRQLEEAVAMDPELLFLLLLHGREWPCVAATTSGIIDTARSLKTTIQCTWALIV